MEITRNKLIGIIAGIVLLLSLWAIKRQIWPTLPQINPARIVSLGQVAADEAVQAVAGHGRIVAVINAQYQQSGNPLREEFTSFQNELKKHRTVSLAAIEVVPEDPDEMVLGNGCSSAQLQALLVKHATADAIVFLIDLPEWSRLQARQITPQSNQAKIVVALNGTAPTKNAYGGYFANGFLAVLIGARPGPSPATPPKTSREWFDKYYQVYTPQNFDTLPE